MIKFNKIIILTMLIFAMSISLADARGGFSSGGGRGGFSSGSRSSFSSGRSSFSSPSRSFSSPSRSTTTTTTTTRGSSYGGHYYAPGGFYHPMMYPGFGMGYGYYGDGGLLTGIIIGNMMHPQGTTVYSGGGYSGQGLLYPDGRVADQNGIQVGNYQNGQFTPVQNGQMIAQPVPANASPTQQQGQPVIINADDDSDFWAGVGLTIMAIIILAGLFS